MTIKIFAEKGYSNTLTAEIAKAALDEALAKKSDTFEQFMKQLILNRIVFIKQNLELFRIFIKEIFYKEQLKKEITPYISHQLPQLFTPIVRQYQQSGEMIDVPVERILKMIFPVTSAFFIKLFLLKDEPNVTDQDVHEFVQFMMHGIQK